MKIRHVFNPFNNYKSKLNRATPKITQLFTYFFTIFVFINVIFTLFFWTVSQFLDSELKSFLMQPRTKRQREVLDYITNFIQERGYEPSYQQIARHFRISSKSAIAKHIAALETQGLLKRHRDNGSFGLQVSSKQSSSDEGYLIEWLRLPRNEAIESEWDFDPLFVSTFIIGNFSPDRIIAYRVKDDSMVDDHFCEGDIALIEKRPYSRDGDIVVVIIDDKETALKKYYRHGANIELRSANENFEPLIVSADKISIVGVVRGLLRPIP